MDYNALKVADLKGLLKERGIPSTGLSRKQQIVEALESHDANGDSKNDTQEGNDAGEDHGQDQNAEVSQVDVESSAEVAGATGEAAAAPAGESAGDGEEAQGGNVGDINAPESTAEEASLPPELTLGSDPTNATAPDPSSDVPTVLEANQPVSKDPSVLVTPRETTPPSESTSADRKRKRRSPTPPVDEESVSKKLKAAEQDPVTLPEDVAASESAIPKPAEEPTPEAMDTDQAGDSRDIAASGPPQTDGAGDLPMSQDDISNSASRSVHPPTRAIYIHNLVRPIQQPQLRDHLAQLATSSGDAPTDGLIEKIHLGSIRTHAFAVFTSVLAATRARSALHDRIWPDEPARKALWVDFVPEERVSEWIERETEGGGGRRDTRRWEIVYDETDDGVVARHHEVTSSNAASAPDRRPSNISVTGQGMPNAPLGPRSSRPSVPAIAPPKQSTPNPTSSVSFAFLDERFPSTSTKPKLYYLPVSKEIADRRLDELERQTSRDWGARGAQMGGDVRRYTFEDGDRLVDGGPHFGDFTGPRGGGGGRGRGGFRGRR